MSEERANEGGNTPLRIGRRDSTKLVFDWSDGTSTEVSTTAVRRGCPCALCVDENTGRPILDPKTVADDLTHTQVSLVGNYALAITFSDGHSTGIFTWSALRRLAEA